MGWYTDDTVEFSLDHNAVVDGIKGNGVISGCAVTEQGVPNNTVAVAAGVVIANGIRVVVSGVNKTCVPHATLPLRAIISVSSVGLVTITHGTQAAAVPVGETGPHCSAPTPPAIPINDVLICDIWVEANAVPGDVVVHNADITDRRIMIPDDAAAAISAMGVKGDANPLNHDKATLATDTLWDALGDVAVGSGVNTAVRANLLAITALGNLGATETIDWATAAKQSGTVDGNTAFTFTNGVPGYWYYLILSKDASVTERQPTWTGGSTHVRWTAGALSSMTTDGGLYLAAFFCYAADHFIGSWAEAGA